MICCRVSSAAPAMSGVECDVPEEAVVHCWLSGQKLLVPGPAHTPEASKQASCSPFGLPGGLACCPADWATPPETGVPAATRSGLMRPSSQGPREEKKTMSLALSASVSSMPHWSAAPNGWTLLAAPAVMMFLAVPGAPMVLAPEPLLPAAKTMIISWLPAAG